MGHLKSKSIVFPFLTSKMKKLNRIFGPSLDVKIEKKIKIGFLAHFEGKAFPFLVVKIEKKRKLDFWFSDRKIFGSS